MVEDELDVGPGPEPPEVELPVEDPQAPADADAGVAARGPAGSEAPVAGSVSIAFSAFAAALAREPEWSEPEPEPEPELESDTVGVAYVGSAVGKAAMLFLFVSRNHGVYRPGSHSSHAKAPAMLANLPGGHFLHSETSGAPGGASGDLNCEW